MRGVAILGLALASVAIAAFTDPPRPATAALGGNPEDDPDPDDRQAVERLCSACHPLSTVGNTPRSPEDWEHVIQAMIERGANGTEEEFGRVYNYLVLTSSAVNVNTAPAAEVALVLATTEDIADKVVERRARTKFSSLDELAAVTGLDRAALQKRKRRIGF